MQALDWCVTVPSCHDTPTNSDRKLLASLQNYVETYAGSPADGATRLNIMCGFNLMPGWVNIDPFLKEHPNPTPIKILNMDPRRLDFPDNSVDEIYSVSLEHIPHTETLAVLVEWYRVLKPGSHLEVLVPDAVWGLNYWLNLPEEERWGPKLANLCGLQRDPGQVHYTLFTQNRLKTLFEAVGLSDVIVQTEWSPWTESQKLRCRGVKKAPEPGLTSEQFEALGGVKSKNGSPTDDTTVYFLGNPLPNVDYDWVHNLVMFPKWKQELQTLRKDVKHYEQTNKLLDDVVNLEREAKERLALEVTNFKEVRSECDSLRAERDFLRAQCASLKVKHIEETGRLTAELEKLKSFYLRIRSLPLVNIAFSVRKILKGR